MYLNDDTMRFMKKWLLPIVMGCVMMSTLVQRGFAQSETYITVEELQTAMQENPALRVIEVSKEEEFRKGHIPGAQNLWRPHYQDDSYPFSGVAGRRKQMEDLLSTLGVASDAEMVVYDEKGNVNAARFRWILQQYAYQGRVRMLQGGKGAWNRAGNEFTTEAKEYAETKFSFPEGDSSLAARHGLAFAEKAFNDPEYKIIDCRSEEEYTGERHKDGAARPGHIPGAIHFDYQRLLNYQGDEYFGLKPVAEMEEMMEEIGVKPDDKVMVYCHSGVRSALMTTILTEVLDYSNARNYDGSWVEWSHTTELPAEISPVQTVALQEGEDQAVTAAKGVAQTGISKYVDVVKKSYSGFWDYLVSEVTFNYNYKPIWLNFFYGLIGLSLFFFLLEILRPWRPEQPRFRKDFWLDAFYMFFNFFLFGLVIFAAVQNVFTELFNDFLGLFEVENIVAVEIDKLPVWAYFGILFVVADFLQWWVHRLLHRVPWLWEFHKVHHSVEQMGFAAHLRYHWMENVVYKGLTAIPLTMMGYNLVDLGVLHLFNLAWGHFNHSNIHVPSRVSGSVFGGLLAFGISSLYMDGIAEAFGMTVGSGGAIMVQVGIVLAGAAFGFLVLRYIMHYLFNSPEMHLWHHAWELPDDKPYGVNFGLTLGVWDWLFGTVYWPHDKGDVRLGFPGMSKFPKSFWGQLVHGIVPRRKKES
jgi:3-mercaptopyruvate sulfurtransferase SseA/sterol desaturase/sphingolipid hydroxylase (fatty acid hydroxylase superfamily)